MTKLKKIMCDEIESHARYALHKYNAISEITIQHVVWQVDQLDFDRLFNSKKN